MSNPALPTMATGPLERVRGLLAGGGRKLLGVAGPPGAGKSTLALAIQQHFPGVSQLVPMDGFHLSQSELKRLGRSHRKGAPDTFDSNGYVALLQRLRSQRPDEIVYAPAFDRSLEEPIAGAIPVHPQTQLVLTEGNYLLLDSGPWARVGALLDDVWYIDVDEVLRVKRLTERHERFGRSQTEAVNWIAATDEPNARLIELSRRKANYLFRWDEA